MEYSERMNGLDEIDSRILALLRTDARRTYADIAKELGLVRQTVKNRIAAMEDRGIIRGYVTLVDMAADSEAILCFIDIDLYPDYFNDAIEYLQKDPMVQKLYQMTGSCRLHVMSIAVNHRQLQYYVDNLRKKLMGVRYITYSVALSTLKDSGGVRRNYGKKE